MLATVGVTGNEFADKLKANKKSFRNYTTYEVHFFLTKKEKQIFAKIYKHYLYENAKGHHYGALNIFCTYFLFAKIYCGNFFFLPLYLLLLFVCLWRFWPDLNALEGSFCV